MKTNWDYSDRARTYDKRADYSESAVSAAISHTGLTEDAEVADIGAGTGKLTKILQRHFSKVFAVEPNDNMRSHGENNVKSGRVFWSEGSAESTGIDSERISAVYFGSSFNVVNYDLTFSEMRRITKSEGWFTCMWNHRDTHDEIQFEIEKIIRTNIPSFDYGARRESPVKLLDNSGFFKEVTFFEDRFEVFMNKSDVIAAWESHDTLYRQSDGRFNEIIQAIARLIPDSGINVPYFTRIWVTQLKI